ncbi:2,3-diphosphoglycerate-dependent phosphoglycerate mutase [Alteromonas sp. ASW11-130]|uniref:2,3-diphosphoglycerate-dependent phosphoglycerate mutase n=1 Tax=Alteromonas sp. ASW11-130 TaxID=3015775 RepID=UPI0022424E35|nr:2,3-diphosphoglycerate-dependent phosphoglycerate mutase [Alteromonas sp. ASW11-130]MCW8093191.1 2,3-diphosphoglycerate-dependent phosphoglycerate mutase [Alteromonas sp. ASW11-130]
MYKLVLIRHGESQWNLENRFTGWHDVNLTETGVAQAKNAGQMLKEAGFEFDTAYTSVLLRAIKTLNIALEEMGQHYLPVKRSWRLNERHYGALTGLDKAETAAKHGEEQVKIWRRSFDIPPPFVEMDDKYFPGHDRRYSHIDPVILPRGESLALTIERVLPYWHDEIRPAIQRGENIIIAAHGNSLRALVKYLDGMSEEEVLSLNIPTGVPLVYELDKDLKPISKEYLGDPEKIKAMMDAVAKQGSAKK